MRLYRNVIEYAASKKLEHSSAAVATLALLDAAKDSQPLYERGLDTNKEDREADLSTCFNDLLRSREKEWNKVWKGKLHKPGMFHKYQRRLRVLAAFEARAELAARNFNLLSMEECDKDSHHIVNSMLIVRATKIQDEYPYDKSKPTVRVALLVPKEKPFAKYERMLAIFHVTREALTDLPCGPIVQDCVILDARPCIDGVWFMSWAIMAKRVKQFTVASGGYFEGELIIGYDSFNKVFANTEEIRRLARHRAVTRALKG